MTTSAQASSRVSLMAPSLVVSPDSRNPAGNVQYPARGLIARRHNRTFEPLEIKQPVTIFGLT